MGKEPIRYEDGRPVYEDQIEPGYTKFTWQHQLWDSTDDRIRASTIAVAAVLVDHANMATCVAWPSLETIAKCSHLSVRTVQRILSDLEEMGWINYLRRGGGMRGRRSIHDQPRGFSNTYQLILPDKVDIGNRGLDIEGPNMDIEGKGVVNGDRRVDISDSNVDTHVQQTINNPGGKQKEKHLKQEVSSNVPETRLPSLDGMDVPQRVLEIADRFRRTRDLGSYHEDFKTYTEVFVDLLNERLPHLVFVGDIPDKINRETHPHLSGGNMEFRFAYAFDSICTFYEGHPRAKALKPEGIHSAFKSVPRLPERVEYLKED